MGLLNQTQQQYYQGNDHGNYQFTSLDNIITQFEVAYVGENKIIPKVKRADIAFHAHRALRELSFDTLKSCKSQEIVVPASLKMILPHDYVDYIKLSWVDSAGIKHPIYYTYDTNNPFTISQDDSGGYEFNAGDNLVTNGDFSTLDISNLSTWGRSSVPGENIIEQYIENVAGQTYAGIPDQGYSGYNATTGNQLSFKQVGMNTTPFEAVLHGWTLTEPKAIFKHQGYAYQATAWNPVNTASAAGDLWQQINLYVDGQAVDSANGALGTLRVGLATANHFDAGLTVSTPGGNLNVSLNCSTHWQLPALYYYNQLLHHDPGALGFPGPPWFDIQDINGDPAYLEWTTANNTTTKTLSQIDVSGINTAYVLVTSHHDFTDGVAEHTYGLQSTNNVDNIAVYVAGTQPNLTSPLTIGYDSITWNNYSSTTPSENNNDDYEDDIYWPLTGGRYGLDPQHAQVNGSFYIDCASGKIHFSSNLAGKTIVLDYISDKLGTDEEMQVHKFAEKAMYKWIIHAILSTSSYGRALVPRLTKEKFAAIRQAKLRLSNLKLGELTQILRGKSKQIKH